MCGVCHLDQALLRTVVNFSSEVGRLLQRTLAAALRRWVVGLAARPLVLCVVVLPVLFAFVLLVLFAGLPLVLFAIVLLVLFTCLPFVGALLSAPLLCTFARYSCTRLLVGTLLLRPGRLLIVPYCEAGCTLGQGVFTGQLVGLPSPQYFC